MATIDWLVIYLSFGLFFGVLAGASDMERRWRLAILSFALWPVLGTLQAMSEFRRVADSRNSSTPRIDSIREELAKLLEAERPGVSIVRARETVDWYIELAIAVRDFRISVASGAVEEFPHLLLVSEKPASTISALSLERRSLSRAEKHLRIARLSFIEEIMNNSLITPDEESRRKELLLELSELCGDFEQASATLNERSALDGSAVQVSDETKVADTVSART